MTRRGFTLIETLVVVAVAGIVAATCAAATTSLAAALRLTATSRSLAQAIRETRARAMAEGIPLEVVLDTATATWSVRSLDGTIRHVETMPAPVTFVSVPASGRLRFESTGTAANGTIVLGSTTTARRSIVVNQRGRARLG
jgi:prepilin-type N-terminal cleavage/methylation domain-containing protein